VEWLKWKSTCLASVRLSVKKPETPPKKVQMKMRNVKDSHYNTISMMKKVGNNCI
jgi:hypothetical protein